MSACLIGAVRRALQSAEPDARWFAAMSEFKCYKRGFVWNTETSLEPDVVGSGSSEARCR